MERSATSSAPIPGADEAPRFSGMQLMDRSGATSLYAAREDSTGRGVVLKVVDDAAPPFVFDALDREAEYLATLGNHPHVITLYQRTTLADGRAALVLEGCPGSVADAIGEPGLTVPQAVSVAIKIAGALETMHRAGLVHCAVRPQNLLLTEFGEPVLADFGSTIRPPQQGFVTDQETTPHTAPELLLGEQPTAATDVYGLSSSLYEMVSGKAAFRAYDGESPAVVSLRILAGGVRPVLTSDVPLALSDLLVWGMTPDPGERPPGAAWLAEELSRIEQHNGWQRTRMISGEPRLRARKRRRFFH